MLGRTNGILDRGGPSTPEEKFWMVAVYWQFKHDPRFRDMKERIDTVVGTPASDYDPRGLEG